MDLSFLRALYDRPGPFASVYLDMRRTEEPHAADVRRHVRCKELADQGAPPETVAAVERVACDEKERQASGCLAVFVSGGETAFSALLDRPPREEAARYAPLPYVVPLLAQRGEPVARIVAVVNRLGARISGFAADGTRWEADVPPEADAPVHKPKGGDSLSQPRSQRAAEDAWRANAKRIAQAVEHGAAACAAEVVVVAGDVRTRGAVLERLPEPVRTRTTESGRNCGPGLSADIAEAVAERRATRIRAAVDRFEEQLTKGGRAVAGLPPVVSALRNAQVASLLVRASADVRDVRAPVWVGPRCTDVAVSPGELRALGVAEPAEDRADAALVRALAGTDGELFLVDLDGWRAEGGLGALLRYAKARAAGSAR
jgi:antitoxin (DNA-binding transcriptional repressor) of toxin-antitoxin stability system